MFIDDGYTPECELDHSIRLYNHKEFPARAMRYDHILYQMGNSMFHYYMYPYLRSYGGILVLHDYNMHTVGRHIALYVSADGLNAYEEYLREDYSAEFVSSYLGKVQNGGAIDTSIVSNGFVSNYASKIIVHSNYAREGLLEHDLGRNVRTIPLYAKVESLADTVEAKKFFGYSADSFVMAAFGHIHYTKRAIPILKAAIRFMKEQINVQLVFVGKLDENLKPEFEKVVQDSGMADRIRVTGYVDLDDFTNYIDATDVCFNLRYPYNGENSGSLARILAKRKAVVVNDVGSFGEVPDQCCVKLPSVEKLSAKKEEKLIYQTMKKLYEDADLRENLGLNARRYVEEILDLEKIAEQYTAFINEPNCAVITESILETIQHQEIRTKRYTVEQARGLAKTLAYCVE